MKLIFGILAGCFYLVAVVAMIGKYPDMWIYTYLGIFCTLGFLIWREKL